jgi:hypothetical protein
MPSRVKVPLSLAERRSISKVRGPIDKRPQLMIEIQRESAQERKIEREREEVRVCLSLAVCVWNGLKLQSD